jgi:hypothetical protein
MRRLLPVLFFLICAYSGPQAYAANPNFPIDEKWSFHCKDANTNLLFQKLVRIAIRDGLATLSTINPTLYKTALDRAENGYPLKWSCESGISSTSYANAFFTPKSMIDGDYETITLTPEGLQNLFNAVKSDSTIVQVNTALATLFHEYLHYLGFDSVSPVVHSYSPFVSTNWPVDVNPDVIVVCTAQAFPAEKIVEVRESTQVTALNTGARLSDPVYEVMARSQASCEVCARARAAGPNSTILTENPNEIIKAQQVCEQNTYEKIRARAKRTNDGWRVLP